MVDFTAHTARIIHRLGRSVTLTPAGGPARVVNAVFTSTPEIALGVDGYSPILRLASADGAGLAPGDAVAIDSENYTITRLQDDTRDAGDLIASLERA